MDHVSMTVSIERGRFLLQIFEPGKFPDIRRGPAPMLGDALRAAADYVDAQLRAAPPHAPPPGAVNAA